MTVEEYESRAERYDKQLREKAAGWTRPGMSTAEKVAALRQYREDQYQKLCDAVYKRRGWNSNGIPTVEKLHELGIDFPDVVALVNCAFLRGGLRYRAAELRSSAELSTGRRHEYDTRQQPVRRRMAGRHDRPGLA